MLFFNHIILLFHPNNPIVYTQTEYTLEKCKMLAEKVSKVSELPKECTRYPEAVKAAAASRRAIR